MKLNPTAMLFWGICFCAGWLLNGMTGGIGLLLVALCISAIAQVIG